MVGGEQLVQVRHPVLCALALQQRVHQFTLTGKTPRCCVIAERHLLLLLIGCPAHLVTLVTLQSLAAITLRLSKGPQVWEDSLALIGLLLLLSLLLIGHGLAQALRVGRSPLLHHLLPRVQATHWTPCRVSAKGRAALLHLGNPGLLLLLLQVEGIGGVAEGIWWQSGIVRGGLSAHLLLPSAVLWPRHASSHGSRQAGPHIALHGAWHASSSQLLLLFQHGGVGRGLHVLLLLLGQEVLSVGGAHGTQGLPLEARLLCWVTGVKSHVVVQNLLYVHTGPASSARGQANVSLARCRWRRSHSPRWAAALTHVHTQHALVLREHPLGSRSGTSHGANGLSAPHWLRGSCENT